MEGVRLLELFVGLDSASTTAVIGVGLGEEVTKEGSDVCEGVTEAPCAVSTGVD